MLLAVLWVIHLDNVAGTGILSALQGKCVMITAVSSGVRRKVFRSKYVPEVVSLVQATMNAVRITADA